MYILGISAHYHDSAAALIRDGEIIAAAQEERFTRKKGDSSFPHHSISFCLQEAGIGVQNLDHVVYYESSLKKFQRLLMSNLVFAPQGYTNFFQAMRSFLGWKLRIKSYIKSQLHYAKDVICIDHHLSHASAAFYPSPFQEAAILTLDGVGEWATTTIGYGKNNKVDLLYEMRFPHSIGLLYSAFTYYTGFKVNFGEYKLMGLAPYGEPKYRDVILDNLLDLKEDGSFQMNMDYFAYCTKPSMITEKFNQLFGGPPRQPESIITQKEMDIAKSVQVVLETIYLRLARTAKRMTGANKLCLAGGVALNCVANGKLLQEDMFEDIWIQPAAGDSGSALGCALNYWHAHLGNSRITDEKHDTQKGSYLGPGYSSSEIRTFLDKNEYPYEHYESAALAQKIAELLDSKKIIGLFHGRMEFGPRALGNRSIIGDPRDPEMQSKMNLKIKFRESFRPFAPSVLEERVSEFFEFPQTARSPYMLMVADVKKHLLTELTEEQKKLWGIDKLKIKRSEIPAITHVDNSARLQTVDPNTNPFYYQILKAFEARTECPLIINTSFNVRGEPIVCTFEDAYRCFMRTHIDYLVLEDCLLEKSQQKPLDNDSDWRKEFALD